MSPILIIVVILVVLGGVGVALYNGIVQARNRVDNAWETIEAQLQRRADLIPNLVNTVKGYASHETETLQAVTDARTAVANAATPQQAMEANDQLSGALTRLFAVAEAYPDLKASANFQQLQTDLTDTEDKISYARMSYNDTVLAYNNAIQTFPGSLVASIGGFTPKTGFEVTDASKRDVPDVQF